MKKRLGIVATSMVVGLLLITIGFTSLAQDTTKIGYANVEFILSQLPEAKEIESDYKIYERQLSNQLQSKIDEFQQKAEAFQRDGAAMTELVRADKQNELRSLQASIEKFQSEAQISLQNKQIELFQPAYKRITETIQEVAEEQGYSYVFSDNTSGLQIILYASDKDDISNIVLKKLGVEPPSDQ
ncbi:MAG: OmpH family outer membrane protein [Bacteroidetes bacterium]|nr:OmpH family outer membrane protein [Bacteroidota bacterium]MCZ6899847.1 OmpH family outer membrane protein [Bacteroidota bacterium]